MPIAAIASAAACESISQMLSSAVETAAASSVSVCAGRPSAAAAPQPSASLHSACWPPPPQVQQLLGEFEWVAAGGESTKSLRRSFRDVLAEGLALPCTGQTEWRCQATPLPSSVDAASDADSEDSYSRCSSPSSSSASSFFDDFSDALSPDADADGGGCLPSAAGAASAAATGADGDGGNTAAPVFPQYEEVDWDAWAADADRVVEDAEAACDWELYDGHPAAGLLHLGDVTLSHYNGMPIRRTRSEWSGERMGSFRVRHRHLDLQSGRYGSPTGWYLERYCRKHSSEAHVLYFKPARAASAAARLQLALAKSNKRGTDSSNVATQGSGSAHVHPSMLDPWATDEHSQKQKHQAPAKEPKSLPERRDNGKGGGAHRSVRATIHAARHSLAAPTRPAIKSASAAHRLVLQQRAARKTQLAQAAAHPTRLPKHMRPHSTATAASRHGQSSVFTPVPPPAPQPVAARSDVSTRHCSTFDSFRRAFYLKHRASLESALPRVAAIRLAPVAGPVYQRFMRRLHALRPTEAQIPLVYHGSHVKNLDSILRRGLLVPKPSVNGVHVAHGSAYGIGIYTSTRASYSVSYASPSCTTILVCAALTSGAGSGSLHRDGNEAAQASVSGDVVVMRDEARVCPLFLLDFEPIHNSSGMQLAKPQEAPELPQPLLRTMLRHAHTRMRKDALLTAIAMRTVVHDPDQHDD